jgi:uncharacterized membrane protein (DUF2068 family)
LSRDTVSALAPAAPAEGRFGLMRAIALYKFLKASLLLVTAYGILEWLNPSFAQAVTDWSETLPYGFEQHAVQHVLVRISGLNALRIEELGIAALAYAGLFVVEGVGLWLHRHWGEWLVVIATASLIPLEVHEIIVRPGVNMVIVLLGNLAILGYLARRLRAEHRARVTARTHLPSTEKASSKLPG